VVREEGPRVGRDPPGLGAGGRTPDEVGGIRVVPEDRLALNYARHHVVEDAVRRFRTQCGRASRRAPRGMAQATPFPPFPQPTELCSARNGHTVLTPDSG
jgi:hypothetical protein